LGGRSTSIARQGSTRLGIGSVGGVGVLDEVWAIGG
jgi:hypothetical protein